MFEPPTPDEISCPNCGEVIKKEATLCRFCQHGLSSEHFRRCPDCAEMVRIESKLCRFCRHVFDSNSGQKQSDRSRSISARSAPSDSSYGSGVRAQVFEVIVRQAMAGAPWREICAGPMQVNHINPDDVEAEVRRRQGIQGVPPRLVDGKLRHVISLVVEYARQNRRWKRVCFPILLALNIPDSMIDQCLDDRPKPQISKESQHRMVMLLIAEIAAINEGWQSFCEPLMKAHDITHEDISDLLARTNGPSNLERPVFNAEISDQEIDRIFQRMGIPPERINQEPTQLKSKEADVINLRPDEVFPLVLKDMREGASPCDVISETVKRLIKMLAAQRIAVWQAGDVLKVVTECSANGKSLFEGVRLSESESTAVMLELVAACGRNLDVVTWKQPFGDVPLLKSAATLASLISFAEGTHMLLVPLISGGTTKGVATINMGTNISTSQLADMKRCCDLIAMCLEKLETDHVVARNDELLKLFKIMGTRFRSKATLNELRTISEALGTYLGFVECSLYSVEGDDLVSSDGKDIIALTENSIDPIVVSLFDGKPKLIPPLGTKLFGFDTALVLPLIKRAKKVGVVIFWKLSDASEVKRRELEIASTFADFLAAALDGDDTSAGEPQA